MPTTESDIFAHTYALSHYFEQPKKKNSAPVDPAGLSPAMPNRKLKGYTRSIAAVITRVPIHRHCISCATDGR
jgi:hypothetical protein